MITVEFDRVREIRYDYNALVEAQKERGLGIGMMFTEENDGPATVRALLWAGLLHDDPLITPRRVGDLMDMYIKSGKDPAAVQRAIQDALTEHGGVKFSRVADIKNPV